MGVIGADPFGLGHRPVLAMILLFLAGLTLAFTPCILPMLPIVANIVAEQHKPTTKQSFLLSSGYGLGVATAYGLLGALIAYAGESLGLLGALQNPVVLLSFAVVFVLLGLYMLEVIHLRLPTAISQSLHNLSQAGNHKLGSIGGSFLVGLLSALVVSPCVSAPLSGALFAVASIGNVWLGFMALFMLGIGLSTPLVIFATTEGKLLPQAGEWMNWLKHGFAYLMFAVALMMIERVWQSPWVLVLWAVWFVVMAWWAWRFASHLKKLPALSVKLLAILSVLWACNLAVSAFLGGTDSLRPFYAIEKGTSKTTPKVTEQTDLNNINAVGKPITVHSLDELDQLLEQHPKVLVDVMADWCIECRIMENQLFLQPPQQMASWQLVKLDITEPEHSKPVLKRYQLVGPPTLLYYQNGQLLTKQVGQVKRGDFEQLLTVLNASE